MEESGRVGHWARDEKSSVRQAKCRDANRRAYRYFIIGAMLIAHLLLASLKVVTRYTGPGFVQEAFDEIM